MKQMQDYNVLFEIAFLLQERDDVFDYGLILKNIKKYLQHFNRQMASYSLDLCNILDVFSFFTDAVKTQSNLCNMRSSAVLKRIDPTIDQIAILMQDKQLYSEVIVLLLGFINGNF
jgi:hypothetical protein